MGNASIKLGIIVVYLVDDDNEKLLDIHLHQIKENISSQFTLYACVNMLQPKFVNKLKQYKFIRLVVCEDYIGTNDETRGAKEHSHYLTQLIELAIRTAPKRAQRKKTVQFFYHLMAIYGIFCPLLSIYILEF